MLRIATLVLLEEGPGGGPGVDSPGTPGSNLITFSHLREGLLGPLLL